MTKKIVIASDHAGFALKKYIRTNLQDLDITDLGPDDVKSVDYPDYAVKLANFMKKNEDYLGILICGSGIGISIAANRFSHIRAALCVDETMASLAREHNDANVLVLGARITNEKKALKIIKSFLNTKFARGRHLARVEKLSEL